MIDAGIENGMKLSIYRACWLVTDESFMVY